MGKSDYEERRQKRVEENKKRLEDLNLFHLSQSLQNLSPKSSPMKRVGKHPMKVEKKMVTVRRSPRISKNPAPVYTEVQFSRTSLPNKYYGVARGSYEIATQEERAKTIEKAEKLASKLEDDGFPTVIRPLLPSHVTGCFWLGLPSEFCKKSMPRSDGTMTLMTEDNEEYPVVYLAHKCGLSGGWRGFALVHGLADGDAIVFQLINDSILKVYIIRAKCSAALEDTTEQ